MTLTRMARRPAGLVLLAAGVAAVGGCQRPAARTKGTATGGKEVTPAAALKGETGATTGGEGRPAEAFARDFLRAVNDGSATPAQLTPAFKKAVAPPVFGSDQAAGFSEHGASDWLARFKGKLPNTAAVPAGGADGGAALFVGASPGTGFTLRLVPAAGGWQADWFEALPGAVSGLEGGKGGPARFAAVAFLRALVGKDDQLAAALMTPALKAKLAPPFESDKALGYNRGILATRLADLRGAATEARLETAEGDVATATLSAGGVKKTLTLAFAKGDRPWDRLVDDAGSK